MSGLRGALSALHLRVRKTKHEITDSVSPNRFKSSNASSDDDRSHKGQNGTGNGTLNGSAKGSAKGTASGTPNGLANGTAVRGGLEKEVQAKLENIRWSSSEDEDDEDDEDSSPSRDGGRKDLEEFEAENESAELRSHYGRLPLVQSQEEQQDKWTPLATISPQLIDQDIVFRARLHVLRRMSPKLVFLVFRDQLTTVQGVLQAEEGKVSEHMVRWAEHIRAGTILLVKGKVQKPVQRIKRASVHDAEIMVSELHVVSERTDPVPFSVYDADVKKQDGQEISDRTRMANRILDLRTPTSQAVFRIQSGVCSLFRSFLDSNGFIEIHTPKLQGGATEGGSSVFRLDYFGRPAFLAQSPQLAKQMCIAADFGRVYEIGPVFRAGTFSRAARVINRRASFSVQYGPCD